MGGCWQGRGTSKYFRYLLSFDRRSRRLSLTMRRRRSCRLRRAKSAPPSSSSPADETTERIRLSGNEPTKSRRKLERRYRCAMSLESVTRCPSTRKPVRTAESATSTRHVRHGRSKEAWGWGRGTQFRTMSRMNSMSITRLNISQATQPSAVVCLRIVASKAISSGTTTPQ